MRIDNRTRERRHKKKSLWHRLSAKPRRLSATATKEHDWDGDVPSIKLSTAFIVMLMLHVVVVGGALLFHLLDREGIGKGAESVLAAAEGVEESSSSVPVASEAVVAGVGAGSMENLDTSELTNHIVRPRESIRSIADSYQVDTSKLIALNKVGEGNEFRVGMSLLIPPREFRAERPGTESAVRIETPIPIAEPGGVVVAAVPVGGNISAEAAVGGEVMHTVEPGETIWAISRQYAVSEDVIMKANEISDATRVQAGQKLRIPSSGNH